MCNPQLVIAGATAVLSYQQQTAQQKAMADAQRRQNEIALRNREAGIASKSRELIQKTKADLQKLGKVEKDQRRKMSSFKARDAGFYGATYDSLLGNYYRNIGEYRNTVLSNIDSRAFQYNKDLEYLDLRYDAQSTYVQPVDRGMNALSSGLGFAKSYYDYKASKNLSDADNKAYDYKDLTGTEGSR